MCRCCAPLTYSPHCPWFCPSPKPLLAVHTAHVVDFRGNRGVRVTCPGALPAPNSTPPSRQIQSTMRPRLKSDQTNSEIHHPWILFSKDSMNHSKMQSLRPLMSCRSSLRREVAKQRPSPHALPTSFNTTDTSRGTSFVSHSLSRVRGK